MGTRVTVIVKDENEDKIFWTNTTSFNTEATVNDIVKQCNNNQEVIKLLENFSSFSEIAKREERFWTDIEYPFGDFEYIIFVDRNLNVSKISIQEYSKICGKSVEDLYDLRIA